VKLKNETYDLLKEVALRWLPGLEVFVLTISQIWGIPYGNEISLTIAALDTFLGVVLGISTANYRAEIKGGGSE